MPTSPIPENEPDRLDALRASHILDTLPEPAYDDITLLASLIAEVPISLISFVDAERQWFKSRVGLDAAETPRDIAFCAHAIMEPTELLVVSDASVDVRFADNPLVTNDPDIRFYAGAPLVTNDGHALGTLCVIDRRPRMLDERQLRALRALSRQVIVQLELRLAVEAMQESAALQGRYEQRLESYQRELEEVNARLRTESRTDPLTGLLNRRAFQDRLAQEVERARRYQAAMSLLMLDVDSFKSFNDAFGHQAGDKALVDLSSVISAMTRDSDVLARYGGEEFAIVLPETTREDAILLAERCRHAVSQSASPGRPVTVSIGVATLKGDMGAEQLVRAADKALYAAKRRGRDRVVGAPGTTVHGYVAV